MSLIDWLFGRKPEPPRYDPLVPLELDVDAFLGRDPTAPSTPPDFGVKAPVPPVPPSRLYRETSRMAWESMIGPGAELDRAIMSELRYARNHGEAGLTCQQIELATGRSHQSVSANLRHLVEKGFVEDSGSRGETTSGRRAMCWRLTPMAERDPAEIGEVCMA